MKPRRIQLSGVFLTTPFIVILLTGALSLLSSRIFAQTCSGTLQTSTQTASFTGDGNNTTFNPNFTQYFPPAGYTLMSATLASKITLSASWDLTNTSTSTGTFRPSASDDDVVMFNGVPLADNGGNTDEYISKMVSVAQGITLAPGASGTVSAPNFILNTPMFNLTVDNSSPALNDFIGMGSLDMTYSNSTGFGLTGGTIAVDPTFVVNTTFTLTYTYCYTGTLAADILSFNAVRQDRQTVALDWLTTNETPGRNYIVEVSNGSGSDFTDVTTIPADGSRTDASYTYTYSVRPGDNGKLFFRLKLIGADGSVAYSALREVDLDGSDAGKFSIYPNPPSDFINLILPGDSQDWQVDIVAADGSLVQRNYYRNANSAKVSFVRRLSAGTYFVRAVNPQTGKHYAGSFLMR